MLVYLFVFSVLLQIQTADYEHYWLFLLAGLPVWVFFATSLQSAARSLLENANLIRKVRFPRQLVPLSMVATQLVGFAVMVAIVVALSLVYVPEARDTVWLALPLAVPIVAFVVGLSLTVASLNALYRDVEHVVAALLLPLFFLTPVLYSLESIPGVSDHPRLVDLVHWGNPLTPALEAFRDPVFFGVLPSAGDVAYVLVAAVVSLALGALVFRRVDDRVAVEV
jgi:ABC-type polysaccharide/polyol phosphate export permease